MEIKRPKSKQLIPENAKRVFKGVLFDVYQWEQELFDGTKTMFEKLKRSDTVIVFPVLDDGRIILTKQEQPGKEAYFGTTGGRVDEGEDILSAAKRELLEESGYEAEEYILWDAQYPTSKIDWVVYTFIAKGLKKIAEPNLDGGEKIELMKVSLDEFIEIGTKKNFAEGEIVHYLFEAKIDSNKKNELKDLFSPINSLKLIEPNIKYKKSYLEALQEYKLIDNSKINIEEIENDFDAFLETFEKSKKGLIPFKVPGIKYWLVEGDKYIGNISYRPVLNEQLKFKGGNIGYSVRPSERGKGYASFMLKEVLDKARNEGVSSVMLSCDDDNLPSKRVIEKAGGIYSGSGVDEGKEFSRYIIKL